MNDCAENESYKEGLPKGKALYDAARNGSIFVEGGCAGVMDSAGRVIIPATYGHIGWDGNVLAMKNYCKDGYSFRYLHPNGNESESQGWGNEYGIFTKDGKLGLDDGRIRIPAEFDEVFSWGKNSDVYYLRKGTKGRYINHLGEDILTEFRHFDGIEESEPYYIYEKQNSPVVIVMELAGDRRDSQTCYAAGEWVRLDRCRKEDVRQILSHEDDIVRIGDDMIHNFYSPFTYIYSAYKASSRSNTPISDCLGQFRRMKCFESSWFYYFVVEVGAGTDLPSIDFDEMGVFLGGVRKDTQTRNYTAGVRIDDSLAAGEVRLFCLLSFTDRWPIKAEFAFWNAIDTFDVEVVQNAYAGLHKAIDELEVVEGSDDGLLKSEMRREIKNWPGIPVSVPDGMPGEKIVSFCEFLKSKGSSTKSVVYNVCDHLAFNQDLTDSQIEGIMTLVDWAVKDGADANFIRNGETGLDCIDRFLADSGGNKPRYKEQLRKIRDCVVRHGGKSSEEVLRNRAHQQRCPAVSVANLDICAETRCLLENIGILSVWKLAASTCDSLIRNHRGATISHRKSELRDAIHKAREAIAEYLECQIVREVY